MLALKRKVYQRVRIRVGATDIWVTVIDAGSEWVRLSFEAPREADIVREEVLPDAEQFAALQREKRRATYHYTAPVPPTPAG